MCVGELHVIASSLYVKCYLHLPSFSKSKNKLFDGSCNSASAVHHHSHQNTPTALSYEDMTARIQVKMKYRAQPLNKVIKKQSFGDLIFFAVQILPSLHTCLHIDTG